MRESAEGAVARRVNRRLKSRALELAEDPTGMNFDEFMTLCKERNLQVTERQARALFVSSDATKDGIIDMTEIDGLLEKLTPPTTGRIDALELKIHEMDTKLDELIANIGELAAAARR